MASWDFAHCLSYFKRMENALAAAPDDELRGRSGPLVLERGPATSPLFRAFFDAVEQAGHPLTTDVNGLAEKAADLICADAPLPPEPVAFFRHHPPADDGR